MRNRFDLLCLVHLTTYVGLILIQWIAGFCWWQYLALLLFSISVQVIHHNHVHLGIWKKGWLNRLTSLFISIISAVPNATMVAGHIKNHHVHQHGPGDLTRTYRFGGDHNHLLGYLLHPFQAFGVLIPKFSADFIAEFPRRTRFSRQLLSEVLLIGLVWVGLVVMDWQKFLLFVLVPQCFGLHWLLGANYFQHAHCDDQSDINYARNFTGAVNWLWFNIGFHTAHHDHPGAHWTELRRIHQQKCDRLDARLCWPSFIGYVVKTFFLGLFFETYRSRSLKTDPSYEPPPSADERQSGYRYSQFEKQGFRR